MDKTKKTKKALDSIHIDINSHNAKGQSNYKMLDDSSAQPHKAKYYIEYEDNGTKMLKYFDSLPLVTFTGRDGAHYVMVNHNGKSILTPVLSVKTNKQAKR